MFIELTCATDKDPIYVNMDRVEAFYLSRTGDHTILVYAEVDQNEVTPHRTVIESPRAIMAVMGVAK